MARKTAIVEKRTNSAASKGSSPKSQKKLRKKRAAHFSYGRYGRVGHPQSEASISVANVAGQSIGRGDVKTARYEIRFTEQQLEIMEKASNILGYKNATDYIRHVMQENASKVIKDQVILQIAEQDRQRFMDELTNPTKPSEAFMKGAELFNKTIKD